MGDALVGHMCGSRGNSGEEVNIIKQCKTNLPVPSHIYEGTEPIFWRNENISLIRALTISLAKSW